MHEEEEIKIACSMFKKYESEIKNLTQKINESKKINQKSRYAEGLLKEVEKLLSCPDYDEIKLDCKNCRTISEFRKQTAELVIKTCKLRGI
ncbi:MAG: hypothetical protein AB1410_06440 [Acidobacteriota bacterium]